MIRIMIKNAILLPLMLLCFASTAYPKPTTEASNGEVKLPRNAYDQMVVASTMPKKDPRPAPAGYALGKAEVNVNVSETEKDRTAKINVTLSIRVLEDEWVSVPILAPGFAVKNAEVNGRNVELVATPKGLIWGVKKSGSYSMKLSYDVDAKRFERGYSLPFPVPAAAAISLTALLPGTELDAAVIPSAGTKSSAYGKQTKLTATIPSTSAVQISWRTATERDYTLSRANYKGVLEENAINFEGNFTVELYNSESVTLKLFPKSVILEGIDVDGKEAPILTEDGKFATFVKGRGHHNVSVRFQVPVNKEGAEPGSSFAVPLIPVSKIELTLPGKKELKVFPQTNIQTNFKGENTIASFNVPMANKLSLSWSEAVPEELKMEVRANASIFHMAFAEEGVLDLKAIIAYDVTRGETNLLEFELPGNVQVNSVTSPQGGIADWRSLVAEDKKSQKLTIFLSKKLSGKFEAHVHYDRSLLGERAKESFSIPLLSADNIHRHRGMVALLSSKDFALKPITEEQLTRVGENQLPAFVKQGITFTVAHTFKYVELSPTLIVSATEPERLQGKYDAQVDTLISLGDVTMKGSASVEVNVKSGTITDLELELPLDINVLSLTAPSLRIYKVRTEGNKQIVDVHFTQEMEGQFRIQLGYEFIMSDNDDQVAVPTLAVVGAEVEQGRIAVEALSAVEVLPGDTTKLTSLDVGELPRQLILKTTNPILLAYKYVHVDPPYKLSLKITRHQEIDVQGATIDRATYRTLFTKDGLAVTSAEFLVRNSKEQFLRVSLPEGSRVWSAFVDGKAEKPALATADAEGNVVLIKIINSTEGFPVTLIYQSTVAKIETLGTIEASLPRPDMIATNSRWEIYLPDDFRYGEPSSNMNVIEQNSVMSQAAFQNHMKQFADAGAATELVNPLRISVPRTGRLFTFEKLYANQSDEAAYFSLSYASNVGGALAYTMMVIGTILIFVGGSYPLFKQEKLSAKSASVVTAVGVLALLVTVGYLRLNYYPALGAMGVMMLVLAIRKAQGVRNS